MLLSLTSSLGNCRKAVKIIAVISQKHHHDLSYVFKKLTKSMSKL